MQSNRKMLNFLFILYFELQKDNPVCKYSTIKTWKWNVYEITELIKLTSCKIQKKTHTHRHTHNISWLGGCGAPL